MFVFKREGEGGGRLGGLHIVNLENLCIFIHFMLYFYLNGFLLLCDRRFIECFIDFNIFTVYETSAYILVIENPKINSTNFGSWVFSIENQVLIEVHSQRSIDNMNHRYHFLTKTLETYHVEKINCC